MKVVIVALALVALAAAQPVEQVKKVVEILRSENEQTPGQGNHFAFESEDGEIPDKENKLHPVITVGGSYTYLNSERKQETRTYEADQNGYGTFGDSIPKQASRR